MKPEDRQQLDALLEVAERAHSGEIILMRAGQLLQTLRAAKRYIGELESSYDRAREYLNSLPPGSFEDGGLVVDILLSRCATLEKREQAALDLLHRTQADRET